MSNKQNLKHIGQTTTLGLGEEYISALQEIKTTILQKQYDAMKAVNTQLISLYWYLGQKIVSLQTEYNRGDGFIPQIAKDLQFLFPGIKGFLSRIYGEGNSFMKHIKKTKNSHQWGEK